jgi:hypothetical protein
LAITVPFASREASAAGRLRSNAVTSEVDLDEGTLPVRRLTGTLG